MICIEQSQIRYRKNGTDASNKQVTAWLYLARKYLIIINNNSRMGYLLFLRPMEQD